MKIIECITLFLAMVCSISCRDSPNAKVLKINNEQGLYAFLEKNTDVSVVELENRIYKLDRPLIFNRLKNITINGNDAVLILDLLDSDVMKIEECENLVINNIKALHVEPSGPVGCTGNVIVINGGSNITISNSEINGCGVVGVAAYDSEDLKIIRNYIHKNSSFSIIYMGPSVAIKYNKFENNGNKNRIAYRVSSGWPPKEYLDADITKNGLIMEGNIFR